MLSGNPTTNKLVIRITIPERRIGDTSGGFPAEGSGTVPAPRRSERTAGVRSGFGPSWSNQVSIVLRHSSRSRSGWGHSMDPGKPDLAVLVEVHGRRLGPSRGLR